MKITIFQELYDWIKSWGKDDEVPPFTKIIDEAMKEEDRMRKGKGLGWRNECEFPRVITIIILLLMLALVVVCFFIGLSEVVQFFVRLK